MTLDINLLGSKLKRYREQLQVTPKEVASATGIAETSLIAFEDDRKKPNDDEILILADYYKCNYKFFISHEKLAPFEQTENLYKEHGNDFSKQDRWAIQEFLFLCECEEFLLGKIPNRDIHPFTFKKIGRFYKKHGADAAAKLRKHFGYQVGIPMDIYSDFRELGFHVFRRKLNSSSISGLFVKHPIAGKCILINYNEDAHRQRFTVAHEAGHAILDDENDFMVSFTKYHQKDLSEIRANAFASNYLIPPEILQRIPASASWDINKGLYWANKLKVSTTALAHALRQANIISETTEQILKAVKVSEKDKIDPELPETLSPNSYARRKEFLQRGLSMFYVNLCFNAYEKGIISAGRLSEMLLADVTELSEIAKTYGTKFVHGDSKR